jgi:uncharacterized protein (TIGR02594 family)
VKPTSDNSEENAPPWLRIARAELGQKEIAGPAANARIVQYFSATRLAPQAGDETPWCSAFACWVMEQAGIPSPARANARSWLSWGKALTRPRLGCVVVLQRGNDLSQGHVAFWVGAQKDRVLLLGGNQGNAVSVSAYPVFRVLGYRWPVETQAPLVA